MYKYGTDILANSGLKSSFFQYVCVCVCVCVRSPAESCSNQK